MSYPLSHLVASADGKWTRSIAPAVAIRARADVERLPAGARDLPRRVGQVQFVQAIGGGDLELRAGVELPVDDVALPQVELDLLPDVVERELDGRAEQVHVVREVAHHAVGVAEGERGVVGLVPHALRDAIEVHQARQVQLRPDGAAPVGEIDGGIAALERLDLDQRDHLLHLRQQSVLQCVRREPGHRRGERVGGVRSRDLDQRDAEAAGVVREHLPGQRLVGEPAGVGGGAVAVVVGRVVGERAVGTVLRLPEVAERAAVGVAQQGAPHGEPLCARAQQEALLDLGVAAPELVDRHVRMVRPPERVVRNDGERAGGSDVRNRDVADLVGHGLWKRERANYASSSSSI